MDELKELFSWIRTRVGPKQPHRKLFRHFSYHGREEHVSTEYLQVGIVRTAIPDFTIPPTRKLSEPTLPTLEQSSLGSSKPSFQRKSLDKQDVSRRSETFAFPSRSASRNKKLLLRSNSDPTSMRLLRISTNGTFTDSYTNSDPLSMSALTLSHLTMHTEYGFDRLTQVPNTHRKESPFHNSKSSRNSRSVHLPNHKLESQAFRMDKTSSTTLDRAKQYPFRTVDASKALII